MKLRQLVYTALLLALALTMQSLRFFIPLPAVLTTFLIGSLVNACILIAVDTAQLTGAILIAVVTPVMAYVQQLLLIPLFILPAALGNSFLAILYWLLRRRPTGIRICLAAAGKTILIYGCFVWLLSLLAFPVPIAKALLFVMSWPQFVTGVVGGCMAVILIKRLPVR